MIFGSQKPPVAAQAQNPGRHTWSGQAKNFLVIGNPADAEISLAIAAHIVLEAGIENDCVAAAREPLPLVPDP